MSTARVVGIGGEPATGKTHLMGRLMAALGAGRPFRFGLVRGTIHPGGVLVLGLYDGSVYAGTDRLSMAVQPDAVKLLRQVVGGWVPADVIVFEGDRLFNPGLIEPALELMPASRFVVLTADEPVKAGRRLGRGDTKPETFLRGRASKYANIRKRWPCVAARRHETEADTAALLAELLGWIKPGQ